MSELDNIIESYTDDITGQSGFDSTIKQDIKNLMLKLIKDSMNWDEAPDGKMFSELDEDKLLKKVKEL